MRWAAWGTVVVLSLGASQAQGQTHGTHGVDPRDDAFFDGPPLAERIHMDLDYAGAPGCAEAELLKDAVRVREYRWEPFAPFSAWRLTIRVRRHGPGYEGSGELRGPDGKVRWRHTLRGPHRCYDLIASFAVDIAVAIRPERVPGPAAVPAPAGEGPPGEAPSVAAPPAAASPAAAPACPEPPAEAAGPLLRAPEAEAQPEPRALAVRFGAAVWPEVVASGWGSLGLSADVGGRYRGVSINAEVHGDPPLGSQPYPGGGTLRFAKVSGMLLLCTHWGWFVGCGVGDAGQFFLINRVRGLPASFLYGAVGARAGLEFPVAPPRFFLRAAVDVLAPINPRSFTPMNMPAFQVAGPSVGLGLGVLVELPP